MLLKCPICHSKNSLQVFCGHCGNRLLVDGVTISEEENFLDSDKKFEGKYPEIKKSNRWLLGIFSFF